MKQSSTIPAQCFLGLDIAKAKADVCLLRPDGQYVEAAFENTNAGHTRFLEWIEIHAQKASVHAGLESTGSYSRAWCDLLHAAGHTVSLLNPARPKAYSQACGQRNKTDRVDARLLARFVADQKPHRWTPPDDAADLLKELVRRREDLLALRQSEKNRVESSRSTAVRQSLARSIKNFDQEIAQIQKEMDALVASNAKLKKAEQLLRTLKGVGKLTARTIMAELPDVSHFERGRQVAAYAGLCPRRHESGSTVRKGGKLSKIGNASLRKALYLPAITAMKHNPLLKIFAERLLSQGKPKMVVVGAVMHKLLRIAFAILKTQKPFDPTHVS
jgi:transposase